MTQKEKEQLLLKDLAARVPYDIMVEQTLFPPPLADKIQRLKSVQANNVVQLYWFKYINEFVPIHCIKPYLRSMSSMTEEEKKYIEDKCAFTTMGPIGGKFCSVMPIIAAEWLIEFYNSHYLDWKGLIPKGLALEAPEGMYNIN